MQWTLSQARAPGTAVEQNGQEGERARGRRRRGRDVEGEALMGAEKGGRWQLRVRGSVASDREPCIVVRCGRGEREDNKTRRWTGRMGRLELATQQRQAERNEPAERASLWPLRTLSLSLSLSLAGGHASKGCLVLCLVSWPTTFNVRRNLALRTSSLTPALYVSF